MTRAIPKRIVEIIMHNTIELLRTVSIFFGLDDAALTMISKLIEKRHYGHGSTVIHQGDIGNSIYIVAKGRLKAMIKGPDSREKTLRLFEMGSYFGELAIFAKKPRTSFVKAMSKCELLMINKRPFLRALDQHPVIAKNLLHDICNSVADTNEQLADSYFVEADKRIIKSLVYLAKNAPLNDKGQRTIKNLPITEIAAITGTTRPTASRIINNLKRESYIEMQKKDIILLRDDLDLLVM
jgi:CRP/FNR family cyclic AMP-dependent transcriptional regulator